MKTLLHRRQFLIGSAAGLAGMSLGENLFAAAPVDTGKVDGGKVRFPAEAVGSGATDTAPSPQPLGQRVGFAVVGLGRLALDEIIPAFGASKKAKLVALVSGTPDKAETVAAQHGIKPEAIYSYADYDKIRENPEVQAVYIVLPNALHAEYTVRAAKAGKHVLCEKPMATSVAEAQQMVDACAQAQRKLMIAYRCQYEVFNHAVRDAVRDKVLGPVGMIEACNYQHQVDAGQWRLNKALSGGGSLPDVGLYCLNTSRFILGEEPTEVMASIWSPANDPRFADVEANVSFVLRFPSGAIANCSTSYNLRETRRMRVYGTEQSASLENAFAYFGQELFFDRPEGKGTGVVRQLMEPKNQFALELDHMADCIQRNVRPFTSGEEGVQDHRVMSAIYQSAASNQPVKLSPPPGPTRGPEPTPA